MFSVVQAPVRSAYGRPALSSRYRAAVCAQAELTSLTYVPSAATTATRQISGCAGAFGRLEIRAHGG